MSSTSSAPSQGSRGRAERAAIKDSSETKREADELYDLLPELRPPKLSPEAIAAAMQAMQIDPAAMDADDNSSGAAGQPCRSCGHKNRIGNKFCAMCGAPADSVTPVTSVNTRSSETRPLPAQAPQANAISWDVAASSSAVEPTDTANGTHHYHHHYHHHFFPGGQDAGPARPASVASRDPERLRLSPAVKGDPANRAEAAVRRVTQDWVLACNTKHLDDLLGLYSADALVLRSNYPSVRGAAAIREFFFNALDAGLGEVEVEPLRVEVVGGIAYEAGRCKALVPGGAAGKRREERGKYLWVFAKDSDGDWKLAADCWSSDLTLTVPHSEAVVAGGAKPNAPRKNA